MPLGNEGNFSIPFFEWHGKIKFPVKLPDHGFLVGSPELFRGIWLGGSALGSVHEDRGRTHWEGISSLRLWLLAFSWAGESG